MRATRRHTPVLAEEVVSLLTPLTGKVVLDCTFGAGGYSTMFLEQNANVIAIDKDPEAETIAQNVKHHYPDRFQFIRCDFRDIPSYLSDIEPVDAIVADIGVSSMQLDDAERGFSFMHEGKLDMRMSQNGTSAYEFINNISEQELADIIYKYGEERASRRIARFIVQYRDTNGQIETTTELAEIVRNALPRNPKAKIDTATKTFQAIRIHINNELDALEDLLESSVKYLKPGGKLIVVTFHSLEDSIVKNFLKRMCAPKIARSKYAKESDESEIKYPLSAITKKPIVPARDEVLHNPRARSAKLRAAMRTNREVEC